MRTVWLLTLTLVALLCPDVSIARSSCSDLLRDGLFDTVAKQSSSFESTQFHSSMCDSSINITEQTTSSGGGGRFGIGSFTLGGTYESANSFRTQYRDKYCSQKHASEERQYDNQLRSRVANGELANAFVQCQELQKRGLEFAVDVRPYDEKLIRISILYDPGIEVGDNKPKLRELSWHPNQGGSCTSPDLAVGSEIPREVFDVVCNRETNDPWSVVVTTSLGSFSKHLRPIPPRESLQHYEQRIAQLEQRLEAFSADSTSSVSTVTSSVQALEANLGKLGPTNCSWTAWKKRFDNRTSQDCPDDKFLSGVQFKHVTHAPWYDEEVRVRCCSLR